MRKKIKIINAVLSLVIIAVMTLVAYGDLTIAGAYSIPEYRSLELGYLYRVSDIRQGAKTPARERTTTADTAAVDVSGTGRVEDGVVDISLFGIVPVKTAAVKVGERKYVVPVGDVFGLRIYSDGLLVVGLEAVNTADGDVSPAEKAGLKNGDIIKAVGKLTLGRIADFTAAVEASGGQVLQLQILRGEKTMLLPLKPVKSTQDGKFRAGLWLRDSSAGIGTMTFYNPENGMFAGLGHAVCDADTTKIIPLAGGEALTAIIKGCYKGSSGTAGELCGVFGDTVIGSLEVNGSSGVYGMLHQYDKKAQTLPVAVRQEVKTGPAQIISTIDGEGPRTYDIEIVKLNPAADADERNMTIEIKDEALIEKTGGIVQGMSGSPIIQNGYLVGAVTHVFLNNSLQGYGIFAENMLKTCDNLAEKHDLRNAA